MGFCDYCGDHVDKDQLGTDKMCDNCFDDMVEFDR